MNVNDIGDATDVAEGEDIPIAKMTTTETEVTIKKAGRGVELTDESVLNGYGDAVGEAKNQLKMAIANKVDNDLLAAFAGAGLLHEMDAINIPNILAARSKFGENVNQKAVLLIRAEEYTKLASEILPLENSDNVLIKGTVGQIAGLQVVVTEKLANAPFNVGALIVAPGALGLEMKRDVVVESDRDIVSKTTVITADQHYVAYLKDESKVVVLTMPK